jgi:hypothetical protein
MKELETKLFKAPVFVTEQNPKALGSTVAELDLSKLGDLHVRIYSNGEISLEHIDLCGVIALGWDISENQVLHVHPRGSR